MQSAFKILCIRKHSNGGTFYTMLTNTVQNTISKFKDKDKAGFRGNEILALNAFIRKKRKKLIS